MELPELIHLEQTVNDRLGNLGRPKLDAELLPETRRWTPLAWVPVPPDALRCFTDIPGEQTNFHDSLTDEHGRILFPVHPLVGRKIDTSSLVHSGRMAVSASYRTVFYEPDPGGPLASFVSPGQVMMIKLHLDDPLPGIIGDRRLTPEKVIKCVELSGVLDRIFAAQTGVRPPVQILRERFGLTWGDRGAIFRILPARGLVPVFSLYSCDRTNPDGRSILVAVAEQHGWSGHELAQNFAGWLAEPILKAVLKGFREGFSLEMHAQNTLVSLAGDLTIEQVYFRDLESVIFFPELRERHGLEPLHLNHLGRELFQEPRSPMRWFNRNLDEDVGDIFQWMLWVLHRQQLLNRRGVRIATRHIRMIARRLISEYGLERLAWQGRWMPFSRSPYGSGFRPWHYYRTRFR